MLKLTFYVPEESKEAVKDALFAVGAGAIGRYDQCAFETQGIGQFRSLEGANPTIGKIGILEKISEVRVEMVVNDTIIKAVIEALIKSHPYETPAYDVIKCLDL